LNVEDLIKHFTEWTGRRTCHGPPVSVLAVLVETPSSGS
jgi:hypothetical protein